MLDINREIWDAVGVLAKSKAGFSNLKSAEFHTRQRFTACVSSGFRPTGLLLSRVAKLDTWAVSVLASCLRSIQCFINGRTA